MQAAGQDGEWQPLKITSTAVARERRGPNNAFDVTFPQAIVWGLIGCVMTFGISMVTERTHGTLVRLRMRHSRARRSWAARRWRVS